MVTMHDRLRNAIDTSGITRYRIAKETGVSQGQLSRFMSGEVGLSLDAYERVASCIGYDVVLRRTRKRERRR